MNKELVKNFLKWLEESTEAEILLKREECLEALKKTLPETTKSAISFAFQLVEEEILARQEILQVHQQR